MKKLKLLIASFLLLPFLSSATVLAQVNPLELSCEQVSEASSSEICAPASSNQDLIGGERSVFLVIADIMTIAAGVIAVVMVIISGITMITSSGDSGKVKKARDTIIYSVIGVFVVLLSRSIVIFIVGRLA